jgi:hypothetical protein
MSEENSNNINSSDEKISDWFLQLLVHIINGKENETGITLNVGGMLVTGKMVSGDKYFEGFARDFTSLMKDEESIKQVTDAFHQIGDVYTQNATKENKPLPQYIHLKDTHFFNTSGKPIPSNRGVWWRGRLSEVSGFTLGILAIA